MNKIIFSPFYDQATYSRSSGSVVCGDRVVGIRSLLSELELRAGMTHSDVSSFDRLIAYYRAVRKVLSDKCGRKPFYADSFEKDDLSVTGELLRWRDALVMSGWNGSVSDPSSALAYKFNDLAQVEKYFSAKGSADRWHDLLSESGYLAGTHIDVCVPRESLDRVIIDVLEKSGATMSFVDTVEGSRLNLKASLSVLQVRNRVDAYRYAAGITPEDGLLISNADNKALNDVFRAHDLPLASADYTESNPLTIQLFKLGFGLYRKDVDIRTLISYLQVPFSPVQFGLRRMLLRHLLRTGGMGEGWDEILSRSEETCPELRMVGKCGESIPRRDLLQYAEYLGTWASDFAQQLIITGKHGDIVEQMQALSQMCDAIGVVLGESDEDVTVERLKKWVDGLYTSCSFSAERAQAGSLDIISDPKAIVDGPERLVWLDCNAGARQRYPLYFLSNAEIGWLLSKGVSPVDEEDFARAASIALRMALGKVSGEIVLVISQKAYGSRCDEHPVFTEIKARKLPYADITDPQMPEGTARPVSPISEPEAELTLREGIKVPERENGESYSSVDTMIQRPVDYVLDYIVGLREVDMGQVADLAIIKGNVAHAVIGECARRLRDGRIKELRKDDILGIIDTYCREMGQLLYNDRMQYGSFKLKLVQSVTTLLKMIIDHKLMVVGDEIPLDVVLPPVAEGKTIGHFNARIDLLLKDRNGDFVIIDMKWSESRRYKEKVSSQTHLQLVLYAKALEAAYPGKHVLGSAYYVIPQYKLETNDEYFASWDRSSCDFIPVEERANVYVEAVNSYCFRKAQIEKGLLENAELKPFEGSNLEYMNAIEDGEELYPLDPDWQDSALKAEAYGSKNYVLKGRCL